MASDLPASLSLDGCRDRQHVFREYLRSLKVDAALIVDPRHVHYLTGHWGRAVYSPLALIEREGPTTLVLPYAAGQEFAADETLVYESNQCCTLVDDQRGAALRALGGRLGSFAVVGCDGGLRPGQIAHADIRDLHSTLLAMRRCKDDDEIALLRRIIAATEDGYSWARKRLEKGMTEVELWAGMQKAVARSTGEMLGEFGNDFQIGSLGSAPRRRACHSGEVAILDVSVSLRGYHSDMCRSFVVGTPSAAQDAARSRILETFQTLERMARPGRSCRELYETARESLDGHNGWKFFHHLGHGVGMNGHEAPRLNPHSNDRLEVGDVFAMEPALYGDELRPGLRIEQMYHVTEKGIDRLTDFPVD